MAHQNTFFSSAATCGAARYPHQCAGTRTEVSERTPSPQQRSSSCRSRRKTERGFSHPAPSPPAVGAASLVGGFVEELHEAWAEAGARVGRTRASSSTRISRPFWVVRACTRPRAALRPGASWSTSGRSDTCAGRGRRAGHRLRSRWARGRLRVLPPHRGGAPILRAALGAGHRLPKRAGMEADHVRLASARCQRVIGGVLEHLAQRWIVEDHLDERVDRAAREQDHLPDVLRAPRRARRRASGTRGASSCRARRRA